jgi:predicted MFS family arabinose efflux permease
MRLTILGIALSGLLLEPSQALIAICIWLTLFGLLQGAQGVLFNFLMAKVIPVSKRGRLTGLRNFLAGITSAAVAGIGGAYFLGDTPGIAGYSYTFVMAFVLTMCGLCMLLFMREPRPPVLKPKSSLRGRLREIPALLRDEPAFTRYFIARALASTGRMAMPFYVLYAGTSMDLTGANLALATIAFTLAGNLANLVWGMTADRYGFRLVFLAAITLWVFATLALLASDGIITTLVVFAAIGAAVQGFAQASVSMTLEFGRREDLPIRIAIANSASELAGAIGPVAGGIIATVFGYETVFILSMGFLVLGGGMVKLWVAEPRHKEASTRG